MCWALTTRLSVNKSISGLVLIICKRLMIISMAIHRNQSIRSIQSNKSNCLFRHTYIYIYVYIYIYIYISQCLASDKSGASTQCLEVNHGLVLSIISIGRGCNGGQIPTWKCNECSSGCVMLPKYCKNVLLINFIYLLVIHIIIYLFVTISF